MRFLLGILTGMITGFMLAPASGSETRRRIWQSASDAAAENIQRRAA